MEKEWQPTPVFFLEKPTDRHTWWATVHGVTRIRHNLATKPPPQSPQRDLQRTEKHKGTTEAAFLVVFVYSSAPERVMLSDLKHRLGQETPIV